MKIVCNGAGAAGIACMNLIKVYGAKAENCFVCDTKGVIYPGRAAGMNAFKEKLANTTVSADTTLKETQKIRFSIIIIYRDLIVVTPFSLIVNKLLEIDQ